MTARLCKACNLVITDKRRKNFCDLDCVELASMYAAPVSSPEKPRGRPVTVQVLTFVCACGCGASVQRKANAVFNPQRVYVNKVHMGAHRSLSPGERPVRLSSRLMIGLSRTLGWGFASKQQQPEPEPEPLTVEQQLALLAFDPDIRPFSRPQLPGKRPV